MTVLKGEFSVPQIVVEVFHPHDIITNHRINVIMKLTVNCLMFLVKHANVTNGNEEKSSKMRMSVVNVTGSNK